MGLITFIHTSPTPDEPGSIMSQQEGLLINGEPTLTIGANNTIVWQQASIYDLFIEIDGTARFNAQLKVGGLTALPYLQNVVVAATGAVTVYDNVNKVVVSTNNYVVTGTSVVLNGYPTGTNYIVSFTAAPTYVAYRVAGAPPHTRPFGGGVTLPRRFRLQTLDLWTRSRGVGNLPT